MPVIDILIPAVEKDCGTLPHVIDSIRKYVKHPIGTIYIVSPLNEKIINLCKRKRCKFVNENTVLPITKKNIHYSSRKWNRSGWLFQQLLKFSGDKICKNEHFLVIDADTVLIRSHKFKKGNQTIMYTRNWSQPEYFKTYTRLLGKKRSSKSSFVSHYMLFNKSKLAQLKRKIESIHRTNWYNAIIRNMDRTKPYAFSEFETYGNYLHSMNPANIVRRKSLNKSLHISFQQLTPGKLRLLARSYRSLSFHKRKAYFLKTKR